MGGQFEEKPAGGAPGVGIAVQFNFPVASPEMIESVENAVTIDLPTPARRLLQRPSDGAQR